MATGLLMLLDDISTILDDVAVLTKVATKKTAGILGDDLALNAQQVAGVKANRELPVVWAVARGSLVNKLILVPAAMLLSAAAPWCIGPLLIIGGAYLCFEGVEKLAHKYLHPDDESHHRKQHEAAVSTESIDIVAAEKTKIAGAIRTDFILSAEIIVITLGTVAHVDFWTRLAVLVSVGFFMTVAVYSLVAGIVKLDDLGLRMIKTHPQKLLASLRVRTGHAIVTAAPYLMKALSIAGTAAMFLVGGGLLAHEIPTIHHGVEEIHHRLAEVAVVGRILAWGSEMVLHGLLGVLVGIVVLICVTLTNSAFKRKVT